MVYRDRVRGWLITLMLLSASPAFAFVRTVVPSDPAACLFWSQRTVPIVLNEVGSSGMPGDAGFGAVEAGFAAWMGQSCSDFTYASGGLTASTVVGYSSLLVSQPMLGTDVEDDHLVVFRDQLCSTVVPNGDDCLEATNDDCDNKYNCWPSDVDTGGDALAYTLVTSVIGTGQILDADTAFDEYDFEFKDVTTEQCDSRVDLEHCEDLQNTMAHEAGHFLGLAHTPPPCTRKSRCLSRPASASSPATTSPACAPSTPPANRPWRACRNPPPRSPPRVARAGTRTEVSARSPSSP